VYPGAQGVSPPITNSADCPPSRVPEVLVTSSWDEAEARLSAGGKVLFAPRNTDLDWTSPPLDNVPVLWNRQMTPAWGRMLGLWFHTEPNEPRRHTLDAFPTSSNFDWQWAQIINNVRGINLERLPESLEPTVWAIDDWNRNYKLGVIFESLIGDGKLLVSAFDVTNPVDPNPVARQLRSALLNYMRSDCFQPGIPVSREAMRSLLFDTRIMQKLGAVAKLDGASANAAIDGDPNTFALAGDRQAPTREQADLVISFPRPVAMSGLVLMPRQDHREHEGDIREYMIQRSDDGSDWHDVRRGELVSSFAPQQIQFARTITTRYLKLVSLTGFGPDKTTALAELAVIYAGPKLDK
jgi:beta-galactosidase